jgi:L-lactate dehydrogenase complex protein LldF
MVTSLPRVYVVIAGIEKIVRSAEDAVLLWQAASRNATGQDVSVYFSLNSGPRRRGDTDGPEEMHVVLLDNGRSRILERGYGDATLCIRCGACINICPVYREIGGHAIGAVLTPLLEYDIHAARDLPFASSLCGACRDVCPVKIDLPRLLLDLRSVAVERRASPVGERAAMRAYSSVMRRPARYRALARLVGWLGRFIGLLPPLSIWRRSRDLPRFAAKRFGTLWLERARDDEDGAAE